jgi:F-box and leucine-rich repeat protein 6
MEISSMEGAFSTTLSDNSAPITTNNNTEIQNHLSTFGEREKSFTPIIPKPEVKIKKLDETKMITDSNENSLTVDTLIEILSSNGTNLPETSSSTSSSSKSKSNKSNNKKSSSSSSSNESNNSSSSKVMSKVKSESSSSSTTTTTSSVAIERSPSTTKNSNKSITSAKTTNSNSKLASPFGGKPTITDLNRKMRQAASTKRQPRTVYQSQISDNSVGIKICIKKSINSHKKVPSGTSSSSSSTKTSTTIKKRSRKSKLKERESDSEDGYVKKRKRVSFINNTNNKNEESSAVDGSEPIQEQSRWARELPKEILFDVSFIKFEL